MIQETEAYRASLAEVPLAMQGDRMWRSSAYRCALFVVDDAWDDLTRLFGDRRTWDRATQLSKALGSITANFSEGYAKGSRADRIRFQEYSLTSAREAITWYFLTRRVTGVPRARTQIENLTEVIKLLTTVIADERRQLKIDSPRARKSDHDS